MTSVRSVLLTLCLLCGLSAQGALAADPKPPADDVNLDLLLSTIRANRRALVATNLDLSAEEATKFWPLYERYQQEINAIGDRIATVVDDYTKHFTDLSNDKALQLVRDYLAAEADRIAVRRAYLDQFAAVLPGRTVARFYQIENKLDAVVRYELASTIPVVDEAKPDDEKSKTED